MKLKVYFKNLMTSEDSEENDAIQLEKRIM